uniref:Uncharacterized protein n=1 Tax=Ignisphaera aggregans TaxID=334771 RepID=A0A7C5THI4_9CREN
MSIKVSNLAQKYKPSQEARDISTSKLSSSWNSTYESYTSLVDYMALNGYLYVVDIDNAVGI